VSLEKEIDRINTFFPNKSDEPVSFFSIGSVSHDAIRNCNNKHMVFLSFALYIKAQRCKENGLCFKVETSYVRLSIIPVEFCISIP